MSAPQPKYAKKEHARLGNELYDQRVRAQVETGNQGKIVAIDVDTGEFEVGESSLSASKRLLARRPEAQIWCVRIGRQALKRSRLARECAKLDLKLEQTLAEEGMTEDAKRWPVY